MVTTTAQSVSMLAIIRYNGCRAHGVCTLESSNLLCNDLPRVESELTKEVERVKTLEETLKVT